MDGKNNFESDTGSLMSPSFSGSMPSAATGSTLSPAPATPIRPTRLVMSPSPGSRSKDLSPSIFKVGVSGSGNGICKHNRQPFFCMECFDAFNFGKTTPEKFGNICPHRRFMNSGCISCGRQGKVVIKKTASTVPVASSAVASSGDVAGPRSNPFGLVSPFAPVFDDDDGKHVLPPQMDIGGSKSYRKSGRKLIKKAKRSSKKSKRSSKKAKRSSKKAKRS